jgi:WD40 repeat protein
VIVETPEESKLANATASGRLLAGEPIIARPAGPVERTVKWARRRPWLAAACAVALAALAAVIGGLFWHNARLQAAVELKEEELARRQQQLDEEREAAAREASERDRWRVYADDMRVGSQLLHSGDAQTLHGVVRRHVPRAGDSTDQRGFEWWYLARAAREPRPAWHAHDAAVSLLAYADDGKALVTAACVPLPSLATQVKVWDLATRKPRLELKGPHQMAAPWCVAAVAGDGRGIALSGERCQMRLVDLTGRSIGGCTCGNVLYGLSFMPDARGLAVALQEGVEIRSRAHLPALPVQGHIPGRVQKPAPAALAGAPVIAVARQGGAVEAWDYQNGSLTWSIVCAQPPTALSAYPRRPWLAIAQGSAPVIVCNGNGGIVARLAAPGAVLALAVSRDERVLAAATDDASVRLWDTATWRLRGTLRWQYSPIHALAFAPDGHELAAGTADGSVHRVELGEPLIPRILAPTHRLDGPVAFAPDSRTVAVGASGGDVAILDADSGQTQRILPGDGEALQALAFGRANGLLAAVTRESGTVRLWDVGAGKCLQTLWEPPGRGVRCVAFAADGKVLATAGTGPEVVAREVATGRRLGTWNVGMAAIEALAFAPKGLTLAGGFASGEVRLWDVGATGVPGAVAAGGAELPMLARDLLGSEIGALAWSPDGTTLAVGTNEGLVRYHVAEATRLRRLPEVWAQGIRQNIVQYSANGKTLMAANEYDARLFDIPSGQLPEWLRLDNNAVALAPSGTRLAVVSRSNEGIWLVDRAGHRQRCSGSLRGIVRSVVLTPDAGLLAVGRQLDTPIISRRRSIIELAGFRLDPLFHGHFPAAAGISIALWDAATGAPLPALSGDASLAPPDRLAIAPDGRHLAAGSADGSIWIWDLQTRQFLRRRFIHVGAAAYARGHELAAEVVPATPQFPEGVAELAFAPDGKALAIVTTRGQLHLWETTAWREQRLLRVGELPHPWLRFSPDGQLLAVGGGGQITLYNPATGDVQSTLGAPDDSPSVCGAFAPDGKTLVTGTADRHLRIWDLSARRVLARLAGHLDRVSGVAFAPDGRTLASCGWDRMVRLWNVATWHEVASLHGHRSRVQAITFSRDGRLLVSGDEADVLLWRAGQGRALEECRGAEAGP